MDLVEIVAERTGTSQGRAKIYVEMAKQRALAHTNRTVYITAMDFCVADLACAMYFRECMVGESSHSEGGITSTFQSYEDILSTLNKLRLIRAGGIVHEKKPEENQ